LSELAGAFASKGVLSPLSCGRINGHFEIVTGAGAIAPRSVRGWTKSRPHGAFTDEEALEIQIIENIQRADVHPFEKAQGFALCWTERVRITSLRKIRSETGKAASFFAKASSSWNLAQPQQMPHRRTHRCRACLY